MQDRIREEELRLLRDASHEDRTITDENEDADKPKRPTGKNQFHGYHRLGAGKRTTSFQDFETESNPDVFLNIHVY